MERSQLLDAMSQLKLLSHAFARFPGQLTNEKVPRPVLHQHRPPGLGRDRHKAHRRPGHGDPDRLRIAAPLVPCLTKGAAQDGGIRPISWPNRAIPPVMRSGAGLSAEEARPHPGKHHQQPRPLHVTRHDHWPLGFDRGNLENAHGQIQPDHVIFVMDGGLHGSG